MSCVRPGSEGVEGPEPSAPSSSQAPPAIPQRESLEVTARVRAKASQQARRPPLRGHCGEPHAETQPSRRLCTHWVPWVCSCSENVCAFKGLFSKEVLVPAFSRHSSSNYTSLQVPSDNIMWGNASRHPEKGGTLKGLLKMLT